MKITIKGNGATLIVDGAMITITPDPGFLTLLTTRGGGSRTVPIKSISAIGYQAAGLIQPGYLQLNVPGVGALATMQDLTFQFKRTANADMAQVKKHIEDIMAKGAA